MANDIKVDATDQ